jgi:hypothetical protein
LLRLSGYAGMPAPGETLRQWHVALPCIRDDRPEVLAALLSRMFQDATDGSHFCIIGFHERDPLREAIRPWRAFRYRSRVYLAGWEEARALRPQLDPSLVLHLEPSTL